ncbi:hypothetical protein LZG00_18075 [Rhodobacteraceae bacterium LMO-12]|nr:hypothetical protein [Rhodobacteraceae bacterium LMO-JJ12]
MTSLQHCDPSKSETRFVGAKARASVLAIVSDADRRQLEGHLRNCEAVRPPFLSRVLERKIRASASSGGEPDDDVVRGGSQVTYSIAGGPQQCGLLVHRARLEAAGGIIPVASLLGATLIGMRVGQRAPLLCEDGAIVSLMVLGVVRSV